jgi:hypothetical protein
MSDKAFDVDILENEINKLGMDDKTKETFRENWEKIKIIMEEVKS